MFFSVRGGATFGPDGVVIIAPQGRTSLGVSPTDKVSLPHTASVVVVAEVNGKRKFKDVQITKGINKKVFLDFGVAPEPTTTGGDGTGGGGTGDSGGGQGPRTGRFALTSMTIENNEKKAVRFLLFNEGEIPVVKETIPAGETGRLNGNLGKRFTYLVEARGHGYMGNVSSEDVCVGEDALPIRFPGKASTLDLKIVGYAHRPLDPHI